MPSICPNCSVRFAGRTIGTHARKCGVTYDQLFWQKVDKRGPDECWPWTGALNTRRYGTLAINRRTEVAPRAMWELTHGPIPPKMVVMHTCDNPPCVNPAHLRLGTHTDNMRDMQAKGRNAVGERTLRNKLTEKDVLAIRAKYVRDGYKWTNAAELAKQYGVATQTIINAAEGRTWSYL